MVDGVNLTLEGSKCKLQRHFHGNEDDERRWKICTFQRHVKTVHQRKLSENEPSNLGNSQFRDNVIAIVLQEIKLLYAADQKKMIANARKGKSSHIN